MRMIEQVRFCALLTLMWGLTSCSDDRRSPDGPEPLPSLSVSDRTVAEGNTCLFNVSLDRTATSAVAFAYATHDITAIAGSDYTARSGSDTIDVGETSIGILVPTSTDAVSETNETFELVVSTVVGATVSDSVGLGTIVNAGDVSFSAQVQPLLKTSCAKTSCHAGPILQGGLNLGSNADYATVIAATGNATAVVYPSTGGLVVQPGNSSISTLYLKLSATPPFGTWMPPTLPSPLPEEQRNLIRDWIDQGALDN